MFYYIIWYLSITAIFFEIIFSLTNYNLLYSVEFLPEMMSIKVLDLAYRVFWLNQKSLFKINKWLRSWVVRREFNENHHMQVHHWKSTWSIAHVRKRTCSCWNGLPRDPWFNFCCAIPDSILVALTRDPWFSFCCATKWKFLWTKRFNERNQLRICRLLDSFFIVISASVKFTSCFLIKSY